MPRRESLRNLNANRYYQLEGTLKYIHQAQKYTTGIIEADNCQKKIRIPQGSVQVEEGMQYKFGKCFYNSSGWIDVKNPRETIEQINSVHLEPMTLSDINSERAQLNGYYITTLLKVTSVENKKTIIKNGMQLSLHVLKCWADDMMVDVTLWNKQIIEEDLLNKWIVFSGFRVKKLTAKSFVIVSTVYTKMIEFNEPVANQYDSTKTYPSISSVYQKRFVSQINQDVKINEKSFSILEISIKEANIFQYQGCRICKKKINQSRHCPGCNAEDKSKYYMIRLLGLDQNSEHIEIFVFDPKVQEMLKFTSNHSKITGKIKSSIKIYEQEKIISHILVNLDVIIF